MTGFAKFSLVFTGIVNIANPFNNLGLVQPSSAWLGFNPKMPQKEIASQTELSKGEKCDWPLKMWPNFWHKKLGLQVAAAPHFYTKIIHCIWWNTLSDTWCVHAPKNLGSHDLTGYPVAVTFSTSGHQRCKNLRILKKFAFNFLLWMSSATTWRQLWHWGQVPWKAQCVASKYGWFTRS